MRANILVYMIHSKGPEYPEYVNACFFPNVFWDPEYRNVLGHFSKLVLPNKQQESIPNIRGVHTKESEMQIHLHKLFPGIRQVIISNGVIDSIGVVCVRLSFGSLPFCQRRPPGMGMRSMGLQTKLIQHKFAHFLVSLCHNDQPALHKNAQFDRCVVGSPK